MKKSELIFTLLQQWLEYWRVIYAPISKRDVEVCERLAELAWPETQQEEEA